ncbi:MAG: hypothetical protein IT581_03360 [Verrucomicrobiales bacterium]|nr:hypothetical protein [Verrucomicrobiales bacterium]
MIRRVALLFLVPCLAATALGQGISGVTRRTTTLEKQATARRFLDSSGVLLTNGAPATGRPATPAVTRPAMAVRPPPLPRTNYLVARPTVVRTNNLPAAVPAAPAARPARVRVP